MVLVLHTYEFEKSSYLNNIAICFYKPIKNIQTTIIMIGMHSDIHI